MASLIATDVAFMGHIRLLLKNDNEPALVKLAEAALLKMRCQVQEEKSPVKSVSSEQAAEYESASNGGAECGIRAVRGLFRTINLCTEKRIGREIPPTHPLSTWLVEHVCLLINALHVGEDGKTAWKRLRGRDFGQRLIGFSENVFFKQPPKGPQHDTAGNMMPRMFPGVFVGYHYTSNSYRVATPDGNVIRTRSLLRRPIADRWSAEAITGITATPWSLRTSEAPRRVELGDRVEKHEDLPDAQVPMPRRLKITLKTLEDYGTTDGCAQCAHIRAFREATPGLGHSGPCRRRIVEAMTATDAGMARLGRQEERVDRAIASRIEAADQAAMSSDIAERGRHCPAPGGCGIPRRVDDSSPGARTAPTPTSTSSTSQDAVVQNQDGHPVDHPT